MPQAADYCCNSQGAASSNSGDVAVATGGNSAGSGAAAAASGAVEWLAQRQTEMRAVEERQPPVLEAEEQPQDHHPRRGSRRLDRPNQIGSRMS